MYIHHADDIYHILVALILRDKVVEIHRETNAVFHVLLPLPSNLAQL